MTLSRQIRAAIGMARTSGVAATFERVRNFAHAKIAARRREAQFNRMQLTQPQIREILGSRMRLDPGRRGLDRDLLLDGIREPIATGHIMATLGADDIALEIGANIGYYALIEARICRRVLAVEPHPDNYKRLIENLTLNGAENVETFNLAFGAVEGEIPMSCSALSNWHSCRGAISEDRTSIMVPCTQIDSFCSTHGYPTFMKMDVEGFELEVLRGASTTLQKVRGLFLELHGDILSSDEIREVLERVEAGGLTPSLVAQYDRPGLARLYPVSQVDRIRDGDRGTFELFFSRV